MPASRVALRCASEKYAGTVITARVTGCFNSRPAHSASSRRISAEISCGVKLLSPNGTVSVLPILRLMLRTVRSGYTNC